MAPTTYRYSQQWQGVRAPGVPLSMQGSAILVVEKGDSNTLRSNQILNTTPPGGGSQCCNGYLWHHIDCHTLWIEMKPNHTPTFLSSECHEYYWIRRTWRSSFSKETCRSWFNIPPEAAHYDRYGARWMQNPHLHALIRDLPSVE